MQVTREESPGKLTLKLSGRFDFNAHRDFRQAYEVALDSGMTNTLEIDFRKVDYLDSSALGMLLLLREKAEASGKRVLLSGVQGTVKQVLDIANFGKLFSIR